MISAAKQVKSGAKRNGKIAMMDFTFSTAGKVIFGPEKLQGVGAEISALGSRVLLVTGQGSLKRTGRLAKIEGYLNERSLYVAVFNDIPPEPSLEVVEAGIAECYRHKCDVVLAIGGGSVLDVGKTIAALVTASGTVHEYFHGRELEQRGLPFVAVPTTAGTGTEVTSNAVLVDTEQGIKTSIRSPYMYPDVAIVDPELTLTMPPEVTAHSGMDALCQAMEALVSRGANPLTDALAEDSSDRLIRNLPMVYKDSVNLSFRTEVALGSLMGGIAFANARLGLAHGLAHPLGVATGLPHGLICALLLPIAIRFNAMVSEVKYARLARRAGLAELHASDEEAVSILADIIEQMNEEMGIKARSSELQPPKEAWPTIISRTLTAGSTKSNPRPVTAEDIEQILGKL